MPQPIQMNEGEFITYVRIDQTPSNLLSRPELSAHFAVILSIWAAIDESLMSLLFVVVPKKGETLNAAIPAMYHAIANMTTRLDIIAAAIRLQRPKFLDEFHSKIIPEVRRRDKERVPFAHGRWVIWDAYPNGLILKPILDFKYKKPMLYTIKDFEEIESRLQGLQNTINDFSKQSSPSMQER